MLGTRQLLTILIAMASCGCASTRSASSIGAERCIAEDAAWVASALDRPSTAGGRVTQAASFATPRLGNVRIVERAEWNAPSAPPKRAAPDGRALDGWEMRERPLASRRVAWFHESAVGSTVVRLGDTFAFELCTATEPQEAGTAGYWEEFQLGRTQDQRLDVAWRWQQGPRRALIGCLGSPRTLDEGLGEALSGADEVFVAVGMRFCW